MQGGLASLGIVAHNLAPALIGKDPLDHAVLLDTLLHTYVKLGPEGALTGALAALDIALWDLKGKLFNQPIYKLLGGAWRTSLPFYASMAAMAAFLMLSGVGKSGSPAPKSTTSTPSRRRRSASAATFMVDDSLMSEILSASSNVACMGVSMFSDFFEESSF